MIGDIRLYRPRVSIVIATRNKRKALTKVLDSIDAQAVPFLTEIIVVDDGSTDGTQYMLARRPRINSILLENTGYRNPCFARNVGYRAATGEIVIAQSDEIVHASDHTICRLVNDLRPGTFCIATVYNVDDSGRRLEIYTGPDHQRPLFFLGSMSRRDLYAVGGNDEEFTMPGYEDDWFGRCLIDGLGLKPNYLEDVVGYHQDHPRPNLVGQYDAMKAVLADKLKAGVFCASGGPWEYDPNFYTTHAFH